MHAAAKDNETQFNIGDLVRTKYRYTHHRYIHPIYNTQWGNAGQTAKNIYDDDIAVVIDIAYDCEYMIKIMTTLGVIGWVETWCLVRC